MDTTERHNADVERPELVEGLNQLAEVAAEPVVPPDYDDIDLTALRICHQPIERRPTFLRPTDTGVDVFGRLPVSSLGVAS